MHIQGDTVLHYTVLSGQKDNVIKLLKHGMRVQHQSSADGATPLHRAAQVGNAEIAKVLIAHGADLNAPNYLGQTPAHVALEKNFPDFAKFMISKGARKKCKHNCMRCQTFNDSQNKNKQQFMQNKKRARGRRHNKYERENIGNAPYVQVDQDELQDHLVVEAEHQNNTLAQVSQNEPELICKDLRYLNFNDLIVKPTQVVKENKQKEDEDVDDINLSDEIKKEMRALGGPLFSKEENEKLRREKMRGGDFKEKSSESSNNNSDPDSPPRNHSQNPQGDNYGPHDEENKRNSRRARGRR